MDSTLYMTLFGVVAALPVQTAGQKSNDVINDLDEDSPSSSTDSEDTVEKNETATNRPTVPIKGADVDPNRTGDHNRAGETFTSKYGYPGPPGVHPGPPGSNATCSMDQAASLTAGIERLSVESSYYNPGPFVQPMGPLQSPSTLSEDNLSVDARACKLPKRRDKEEEKTKLNSEKEDAKKQKEKEEKKFDEKKDETDKDMLNFIKDLVQRELSTPASQIVFFDAAILYDKDDYQEAVKFRADVTRIAKNTLNEDVHIELFDSDVFAQSKIYVVQDIVDRCSVVFVYLTENFRTPELELFIEEAIGMTRLGLNHDGAGSGVNRHDRSWMLKPVHTAPLSKRTYKTPVGLLSVHGLNWYDQYSEHTKHQVVTIMRDALNKRKQREMQSGARKMPAGNRVPPWSAINEQPSQLKCKPEIPEQTNMRSHVSNDAMSFNNYQSNFRPVASPMYNSEAFTSGNAHSLYPERRETFNSVPGYISRSQNPDPRSDFLSFSQHHNGQPSLYMSQQKPPNYAHQHFPVHVQAPIPQQVPQRSMHQPYPTQVGNDIQNLPRYATNQCG